MFGSNILDVVIGLVFVYVQFSLICSALTEGVARLFAMRSGTLESAIRNMIEGSPVSGQDDETDPKAPATIKKSDAPDDEPVLLDVKTLYTSARLRSLARVGWFGRLRFGLVSEDKKWRAARPSYIPSHSFTLALFDTLLAAGGEKPPGADVPDSELQEQIDEVKAAIETVMPEGMELREQMIALLASQDTESMALQTKAQATYKQLKETVGKIQPENSYLRQTLESILANAEQEAGDFDEALAKTRIGVEEWFDDSMERVSGWYARNTRSVVVGFAIAVTLIFNIDTLAIATALQVEPLLREAIVSQADEFIGSPEADEDENAAADPTSDGEEPSVTITELQDEIDKLGVPIGWVVIIDSSALSKEPTDAARQAARLLGLGLSAVTGPAVARWDVQNPKHVEEIEKATRYRQEWPSTSTDWGKKFAGLFVTIVALSLGAPFWFDALNKLVNLRAAGKAPARADAVDASISVNAPGG